LSSIRQERPAAGGQPIPVTGVHRSRTSWLGAMLSGGDELYDRLGLDYGNVRLDSRTSIGARAPGEIERVPRETQDVWPKFYAERHRDAQASPRGAV